MSDWRPLLAGPVAERAAAATEAITGAASRLQARYRFECGRLPNKE